jgi:hypothetical protein
MLINAHPRNKNTGTLIELALHVSSRRDYWHVDHIPSCFTICPEYYELLSIAFETGGSIDSKILDRNG